jgi:hypothetical protein
MVPDPPDGPNRARGPDMARDLIAGSNQTRVNPPPAPLPSASSAYCCPSIPPPLPLVAVAHEAGSLAFGSSS